MAFKMRYKNLQEVVDGLNNASKKHAKQAKVVKDHIKEMEDGSPHKKYASAAQRKAIWASKKDGGAGNPNKKLDDLNNDGKISKADVLVGRGVIDKEGNPLKKKGPCWKGYEMIGMKNKGGRKVPNCVPKKK